MSTVKFWFDSSCPFAWMTSRWIKQVEKVRDIRVEWMPFSLAVLNEDKDISDEYAQHIKASWGPARVVTAVKNTHPAALGEFYTALGTLIHVEGDGPLTGDNAYRDIIQMALGRVGLDSKLEDCATNSTMDNDLRAYHQQAIDLVGDDVGTPVLQLGDTAFFGPVITRLPETDEEAGELFDASLRLSQYPYFFELKRSRTEEPQV